MDCHHFGAGRCRSCTWLARPYAEQVDIKQQAVASALGFPPSVWEPPVIGAEEGFRNKAKMVVSGTTQAPVLGILDPRADDRGRGIDLRDCGLHEPSIQRALPVLAAFVTRAALAPYDVASRRGELKYLLVTASPEGGLMVRFVTRSQEPVTRVRKHLPWLVERLPDLVVASVNLQPEHKAVLEGEVEILLTEADALPVRVNDLTLHLRPGGFFQTNTAIAAALYRTARAWVADTGPSSVWDLYCGVGGFALHLATEDRDVVGIETSSDAVASARLSADGLPRVRFATGDATAFALGAGRAPDLVVVNPPRRGIGVELAQWLERSSVGSVVYSSCNPVTLARDLAEMPRFVIRRAQLFDMFPHTDHAEVLVLLERDRHPTAIPASFPP